MDYLHILTADNVGRAEQNGVSEALGSCDRLLDSVYAPAARARDAYPAEQLVEPLAVLCGVDTLGGGTENADALTVEEAGELDGCLPAERNDDAYRLLYADDAHDIFLAERLKVESVGGVVVGGDGLGVVVDYNDVVAALLERPYTVHRRIVKLDALSDAYRSRAENHDNVSARARMTAGFAVAVGA